MIQKPHIVEKHYFRFAVGPMVGTALATKLSDGNARGHAMRDEDWWQVAEDQPWSDAETVAKTAVRALWHRKHNTGLTGADPLPIINSVELHAQDAGLKAGEYYPRIWRPRNRQFARLDVENRTDSRIAIVLLEESARAIFEAADPTGNRAAFGHKIRTLLMLACMEVENAWKEILRANGIQKARLDTNDYFKTNAALQLVQWRVVLKDYPRYPELTPFAGWKQSAPTESLGWLDAYNATKHGRQAAFDRATVEHAISALAAAWVLHGAQFGPATIDEDSLLFRKTRQLPSWGTAFGYVAPIIDLPSTPHQPVSFPF